MRENENIATTAFRNKNDKYSKMELIVRCHNLPSFDAISQADPMVALYTEEN